MATEALIAHVVVSKFCDSLPLYRQAGLDKRITEEALWGADYLHRLLDKVRKLPEVGQAGGVDVFIQDRAGTTVDYLWQNTQRFMAELHKISLRHRLDEATWAARRDQWLPSAAERAYVRSGFEIRPLVELAAFARRNTLSAVGGVVALLRCGPGPGCRCRTGWIARQAPPPGLHRRIGYLRRRGRTIR